jgi:ketosteroid isomerase-like protein
MRHIVFALALSLAAGLAHSTPAQAAPAEKEVLAAQDVWKQAMIKKDKAAFDKVLHPELRYGHSSGKIEAKAEAIQHFLSNDSSYSAITFSDTKVMVQGNTAVVTGKVDYMQRHAGKEGPVNLVVLSVWSKGPQGWQMLARQSTKPPAPAAATTAAAAVPAAATKVPAAATAK